ncbi:MAG: hypothetical protein V5788_06620 [Shewanella sp.]
MAGIEDEPLSLHISPLQLDWYSLACRSTSFRHPALRYHNHDL